MVDFGHELSYFARWHTNGVFPNRASSAEFWRSVCPKLTISDDPFRSAGAAYEFPSSLVAQETRRVCEDGYLKTAPAIEQETSAALADGVERIIAAGYHPLFLSVFDEYWKPFARLGGLLEPVFGAPPRLLGDYWVWCVGPGRAPAGWAPHRDHEVNDTVGLDGRPTLLTVWIPYTDSTPENGCIYALPTSLDPNLPSHQEIRVVPHAQYVTALPADAGSVVAWNQYILHWGGRCSPYAPHPRISTGIYFQSSAQPDYRRAVPFDEPLPFEARLTLIANAFRRYHETFGFPSLLLDFVARHADP